MLLVECLKPVVARLRLPKVGCAARRMTLWMTQLALGQLSKSCLPSRAQTLEWTAVPDRGRNHKKSNALVTCCAPAQHMLWQVVLDEAFGEHRHDEPGL